MNYLIIKYSCFYCKYFKMYYRVKLPRPDFEPKLAVPTVTIVPADGELWLTFSLRRNPNNL